MHRLVQKHDYHFWQNSANSGNPSILLQGRPAKLESIRGRIFSRVRPFYERAVSDLDPSRYMHRPV
jgi:hypothetical protein